MSQTNLLSINFEESGPITLEDFVKAHPNLSFEIEKVQDRPDPIEWHGNPKHYRCILKNEGKQFTVYLSTGESIEEKPDLIKTLQCVVSDAIDWFKYQNLDSFKEKFRYEGKELIRIHKGCEDAYKNLERLFPKTSEILFKWVKLE